MFDLLIAIIFSAMIPVILKYAHKRHLNDEVILTINYVVAVIISICFVFLKWESYSSFFENKEAVRTLIVIGAVAGIFYYTAFFFYQKSVKENGVSLSIAVGKMGIIIPMVLSLLIWRDFPTSVQWVGIVISLVAIGLINISPKEISLGGVKTSLLLFFAIGGLGDFANKVYEVNLGTSSKDLFLGLVFFTAFLASLYKTLKVPKPKPLSFFFGCLVGIPNMLTAYFLISALSQMNATVVFPMYSGGAIVLSMIWSFIAFKEKLKIKELVGIIMILLALIMINL